MLTIRKPVTIEQRDCHFGEGLCFLGMSNFFAPLRDDLLWMRNRWMKQDVSLFDAEAGIEEKCLLGLIASHSSDDMLERCKIKTVTGVYEDVH